ncbi:unnamed protein product [Dicrocoelium dendriticum]|nr:unnamed protein product [Dicrocoelium dendriticum]
MRPKEASDSRVSNSSSTMPVQESIDTHEYVHIGEYNPELRQQLRGMRCRRVQWLHLHISERITKIGGIHPRSGDHTNIPMYRILEPQRQARLRQSLLSGSRREAPMVTRQRKNTEQSKSNGG